MEDFINVRVDPVSRANYGVLLKPIKVFYLASSTWMHVLKLRIPPWMEHPRFLASALCTKEVKVEVTPPLGPCEN